MFGMYEEHDEVMGRRQVAFEALFGEGGSGHRTLLHRFYGIRDVRPGDTADTEWIRSVLHWQLLLDRWQCLDEGTDGAWDRVLARLQADADARGQLDWRVSVDSTVARVHQHGATAARRVSGPSSHTRGSPE